MTKIEINGIRIQNTKRFWYHYNCSEVELKIIIYSEMRDDINELNNK